METRLFCLRAKKQWIQAKFYILVYYPVTWFCLPRSSSGIRIRLHTKNQIPNCPGRDTILVIVIVNLGDNGASNPKLLVVQTTFNKALACGHPLSWRPLPLFYAGLNPMIPITRNKGTLTLGGVQKSVDFWPSSSMICALPCKQAQKRRLTAVSTLTHYSSEPLFSWCTAVQKNKPYRDVKIWVKAATSTDSSHRPTNPTNQAISCKIGCL